MEETTTTRVVIRWDAVVTVVASLITGFCLGIAVTMAIVADALVNR